MIDCLRVSIIREPSSFRQNYQKHKNWPSEFIFDFTKNRKYTPRVGFDDEYKTGMCFEMRQRQQKCRHKPKVQLLANPPLLW